MKPIPKLEREQLNGGFINVKWRSKDTAFDVHRHDYYEIILYKNCSGSCILNGKEYKISGNCLFMLTPEDYHKIITVRNDASSAINVSFSENIVNETLLSEIGFVPRVMTAPSAETIRYAELLHEYYNGTEKYKNIRLGYLLNLLLTKILEHGIPAKDDVGGLSPGIRDAMSLVLSDLSRNYSLAEIAKISGMSAPYFSHLFHKETGKPYKKWLTTVRIEYAKRIIEEKDASVIEISYECGYNTPSQFLKMFKRETSMTPTEYRKKFIKRDNV